MQTSFNKIALRLFVCVIEKHSLSRNIKMITVYRPTLLLPIHGLCPQVNLSIPGHCVTICFLTFSPLSFENKFRNGLYLKGR